GLEGRGAARGQAPDGRPERGRHRQGADERVVGRIEGRIEAVGRQGGSLVAEQPIYPPFQRQPGGRQGPPKGEQYGSSVVRDQRRISAVEVWWTRSQPIRTVAQLPLYVDLPHTVPSFLYLQIAENTSKLRRLGMSGCAIARALKADDKTVAKALRQRGGGS